MVALALNATTTVVVLSRAGLSIANAMVKAIFRAVVVEDREARACVECVRVQGNARHTPRQRRATARMLTI